MTRNSSGNTESQPASRRALNEEMTQRLLDEPLQTLVEGSYALRVLETRGRVSGLPRRTPIGLVQLARQWWVVSPDRYRDWVRNLQTDSRCAVVTATGRASRWASPAGSKEVAMVVATYLSVVTVPWAQQAFPVSPDTPQATLLEQAPKMAVFRLDASKTTVDAGKPGHAS